MVKAYTGQPSVQPMNHWVGERGLRVETGDTTLARYALLLSMEFDELEDMIPADGSIFLLFRPGRAMSDALRNALAQPLEVATLGEQVMHTVLVNYGGDAGPDLARLAEHSGMDEATYIQRHSAADYMVAFLGFQPGFPYLRGLPPELHAARRATPRVQVAAGSVAIGGAYTGIYPASGPGGWQIIGRTEAVVFDPARPEPVLMLPGDRVRFVPND